MIIKTQNPEEIKVAAAIRDQLRSQGEQVYVIPQNVMYFFVTLDEKPMYSDLIVQVMYECDVLDEVRGFGSAKEAYEYATKCAYYAGLSEEEVEGDVSDVKMQPTYI